MILALLDRAVELGQRDDWNVQLTSQRFQRAGNVRYLLLAVVIPAAVARHQLKIVNKYDLNIVIQLILAGSGAELLQINARGIIDDQLRVADYAGPFHEFRPLVVLELACSKGLGIDARFKREETVHQLVPAHLKREQSARNIFPESHILGNVEHEGCLSHGRSCRDQNKIRRLKAGRLVIQVQKSSRQTGSSRASA